MAAQVIGSSGSELSRSVYIDKGERDGIKPDMAVISRDGIVGKVLRVYGSTSLVLLIDDQTSGVGSILDQSRLQGILRGTSSGAVVLEKVMSDETVPIGEQVLTSGGDGIFPKGLPVGTVTKVSPGNDLFLNIRVRPAADLSRLEEVLVVTKVDERLAEPDKTAGVRAADILAERLPTVPPKVETAAPGTGTSAATGPVAGARPSAATVAANTGGQASAVAKPKPASSAGSAVPLTPNGVGLKAAAGTESKTKPGTAGVTPSADAAKAGPNSTPLVIKKNAVPASASGPIAAPPLRGTTKQASTKAISLTSSPAAGSKPQPKPPQAKPSVPSRSRFTGLAFLLRF
jgi:rod shape-determining protein MreC